MTDQDRDRETEERIGEFVRRHAGLYHDPPPTPREAIWSRIEAERERRASPGPSVIPIRRGRRVWATALAAAAVLALGVALGRISTRQEAERAPTGPTVVAERAVPEPEGRPEAGPGTLPESLDPDPDPETLAPVAVAPRRAPRPAARAVSDAGIPAPEAARRGRSRNLYRLASVQMLGQAEALLVEYRTGDRMDPGVARWARDVLASNRLLLDSPAADDPGMRRLLEDLELVLAQIVHRAGGGDPLDDDMIDRTIEDRGLMTRLRGAIPAGGLAGA